MYKEEWSSKNKDILTDPDFRETMAQNSHERPSEVAPEDIPSKVAALQNRG